MLGLDRFEIVHDRGSMHGETRIIRLAYHEQPDYVALPRRAYELWRELEAGGKTTLPRFPAYRPPPEDVLSQLN